MKIIDAHAHLIHKAKGIDAIVESGVFEQIFLMDLSGIGRLGDIELATQSEILEMPRRYPGFFRVFGFIDLDSDTPSTVRELRDKGFCGLKPYKQRKPYGDESYFSLYAEAARLGMPVLFHTGLIAQADAFDGTFRRSFGPENMRPGHLAGIAEAFPDLSIIAGHMGWPYLPETEQNLYYYKNISGDISGYVKCIDSLPALLDRKAHDGTDRFFNEKLHFATDEFYGSAEHNARALRLTEFWKLYFEFVGALYYRWGAPAEQEKFFHDNAIAVFPGGKNQGERA